MSTHTDFQVIENMLNLPPVFAAASHRVQQAELQADYYRMVLQSAMFCLNNYVNHLTTDRPLVTADILEYISLVQRAANAYTLAHNGIIKSIIPDPQRPPYDPLPTDMKADEADTANGRL